MACDHYRPVPAVRCAIGLHSDGPGKRHHQSAPRPVGERAQLCGAVNANGFNIPSLNKREARTTVELRDGQSFSIAGLLQTDNRRNVSQLPWIGSVPVLGTLFSSKPFVAQDTDLVVVVTPHLVAPAVPGQRLASPLDNAFLAMTSIFS